MNHRTCSLLTGCRCRTALALPGSALVTLGSGLAAHRVGYRRLLLGACGLMLATGVLFSYLRAFWPLFIAAFVGTLNPSAGDVS